MKIDVIFLGCFHEKINHGKNKNIFTKNWNVSTIFTDNSENLHLTSPFHQQHHSSHPNLLVSFLNRTLNKATIKVLIFFKFRSIFPKYYLSSQSHPRRPDRIPSGPRTAGGPSSGRIRSGPGDRICTGPAFGWSKLVGIVSVPQCRGCPRFRHPPVWRCKCPECRTYLEKTIKSKRYVEILAFRSTSTNP